MPATQTATWTVLVAGSILPRAGYGCSGYALRPSPNARVTLFDCGPGTIRALGAAGIDLAEVERVVVSHFHPDHWLDLFALAFARRNPAFQPAVRDSIEVTNSRAVVIGNFVAMTGGAPRWSVSVLDIADPQGGGLPLMGSANNHTPEPAGGAHDLAITPNGELAIIKTSHENLVVPVAAGRRRIQQLVGNSSCQ